MAIAPFPDPTYPGLCPRHEIAISSGKRTAGRNEVEELHACELNLKLVLERGVKGTGRAGA